jgi:tetratricopeptide (TPR) repeat protein
VKIRQIDQSTPESPNRNALIGTLELPAERSETVVNWSIESHFRRIGFTAVCVLSITIYAGLVLRPFQASHLAARPYLNDLQRAIQLEPSNAEYYDRLGKLLTYTADDPEAAVSQFQVAVRLNPYAARYWLDLTKAYLITGRISEQRTSLESAVLANPTTPDIAWQAANFFLLQGDKEEVLLNFRIVLANDPTRVDDALQLCLQVTKDINQILDQAAPEKADIYFSLLHLLIQKGNTVSAQIVWKRLIALKQPFGVQLAFPYIRFLLAKRDLTAAEDAWRNLASLNPGFARYLQSPANLVVNGGFEQKILDGGFDWLCHPSSHVTLAMDGKQFYSGTRSLVITFDGQNPPTAGIVQFIPVKPNTDYEFSAAYRTEDIMSASGPRFSIADAYTNDSLLLTDDFLGTLPWRLQNAEFRTGPNTELLLLTVSRQPAEPLIRGKLWIDDVRLSEKK